MSAGSHAGAGPSGFGGWLILVVIGQTLGPFATVIGVLASLDGYKQLMPMPGGSTAVYGEVALNAGFLIMQVIAAVAMYQRSRNYPKLFLYQWLALIALVIGDIALVATALGVPVSLVLQHMGIGRTLLSIAISGLWVLYMFTSVRVQNTFTR